VFSAAPDSDGTSIEARATAAMPDRVRRVGRLVLALALAGYVATSGGSMATDIMSYEVTKGMVERGSVAMSYNVYAMDAHRGVDGRYYAPYGIGQALYSIPFYLAGVAAERVSGLSVGKPEAIRKSVVVLGNTVATALAIWVAFLFAWRISGNTRAAVANALILGFATLLWPYAKFGFNAPLSMLSVLFGTYAVWVGVRASRPWMLVFGGAGLGSALLVRHELALACLPIGVWIAAESGFDVAKTVKRGALVAAPVVAAGLLVLFYNYTRFGNPFDTGYLRDETVSFIPVWEGLFGLLASPGRSFFLYSPITLAGVAGLVWLARLDRSTALLFAGHVVVVLLFYASLVHWDADRSYGPRYLLPLIPWLVLPLTAVNARSVSPTIRKLVGAVAVLSVLIQLPGVLVDFSKVGYTAKVGHRDYLQRRWTWEAAGLRLNSRAAAEILPHTARHFAGTEPLPVIEPAHGEGRDFAEQFANSLDFWWISLFYLRAVSGPVALGLGTALLGLVALAWSRIQRELARQDRLSQARTSS
jgi:hypothetical protein